MAFLDETGLAELWSIIKGEFSVFYQHYWLRRTVSTSNEASVTATYDGSYKLFLYTGDKSSTKNTYYYADSYTVSGTNLVLNNPATATPYYSSKASVDVLKGKYCCAAADMTDGVSNYLYYIRPDATATQYTDYDNTFGFEFDQGNKYKVVEVTTYSEWERLSSPDASAYPSSGVVGNEEYMYVGVPFENATSPHIQVATGSYVGTGASGSNHPCALTFDFAPKMVIVYSGDSYGPYANTAYTGSSWGTSHQVFYAGSTRFSVYNGYHATTTFSLSGNTLTWYSAYNGSSVTSSAGGCQMNAGGNTYHYIAIG